MANSFVRYTGNGSTTTYSIPFSYRVAGDLTVTINAVATTAFSFNAAGTTITFTTAPANSAAIEIRRTTSQSTRLTDYSSGSVLTESDLDTDSTQAFFMSQEAIDESEDKIAIDAADFQWTAANKRIKNVAAPTLDTDAVNRGFVSTNIPNITTVSGIASNVTTVAGIAANVTTVAGNNANVSTVATNIGSVNTVATNIADVVKVADDLNEAISEIETAADDLNEATSEIDTVATNIANVNTVGTGIANVNTVAGISSNVTTVAGISGNVTTVAGISSNVTSVAGNTTNINAVNSNSSNINTVAGNTTNVNTVAGISGNVTTVAGISSDVTAVAADATDIGAVAGKATEIGRLGTAAAVADLAILGTTAAVADMAILATADIVADMNTLGTADVVADMNTLATADVVADMNTLATADIVTDMNLLATSANVTNMATLGASGVVGNIATVAGISGNVTTVAGISANVTTAATNNANITTVAGAIANVNTVGGAIANVNTVASNVAGVNSFADRYRVGASDPTASLDEGDLAFNTTANVLKYYDGANWQAIVAGGLTDIVQDGSPQLGGTLDVNGNSIVSVSNGNIAITPNGSGKVILDGLSHPTADGSTGQFLKTDGAGNLSFATVDTDIVADTTPQLGGDLDLNSNDITGTGNINITGGVTMSGNLTVNGTTTTINSTTLTVDDKNIELASGAADSAAADGAGLTVDGASATLTYTHSGTKWNVNKDFDVTGNIIVSGTVDGRDLQTDGTKLDGIEASADVTDTANVTSAGALMDSEVTNLAQVKAFDSSAYATAAQGTLATNALPKAGGTMTGNIAHGDNVKATFGAGTDLEIYHDGNDSYIKDSAGTGDLLIQTNKLQIVKANGLDTMAKFTGDGAVELRYDDAVKFVTTSSGATVTGTLTATTLAGSLPYSSLTGTPTIPSNTNQLTNGNGFVTSSGVTSVATGNGLTGGTITSTGTVSMSGSYSGSFSASGNISAYSSDQRLKNFKGKIENALDKVEQLNGYYYEWNDVAKGIDADVFKDGIEVGVNAQEVEAVLPEVITEAPIVKINNLDTDYKTVYYDKIVPLLIEAIKELKVDLDSHKKHCTCGDS